MPKNEARDNELIQFIDDFLTANKYAPSFRDISHRFGLSSSSTISQWVNRLKDEGRVIWQPGDSRTLRTVKWEDES